MENEPSMSSPQARKQKAESYAYSWFLPAPGSNGSVIAAQMPLAGQRPLAPKAESQETIAMEARTEAWRHSGGVVQTKVSAKGWSVDSTKLRIGGIAGWSAVAGTGAVLLSTRAGTFPGVQLGVLAVVWLAVSAAVWYVPRFLPKKGTGA